MDLVGFHAGGERRGWERNGVILVCVPGLYCFGMAAMISVIFGIPLSFFFLATLFFSSVKLRGVDASYAAIKLETIDAIASEYALVLFAITCVVVER